jgi:outer membrane protein assembly factor BamA
MTKFLLTFLLVGFSLLAYPQLAEIPGFVSISDSVVTKFPDQNIIVGYIQIQGNSKTVERIIYRELVFKTGDTLSWNQFNELMKQSRENLLNRSLFNFVDISYNESEANPLVFFVLISVVERWYIWPLPIFELADRNFNVWWKTKDFSKVNYGMYVSHNNFRGRNEKLKVLIRAGYDQNYFLSYEIPYITKKQNFGVGFQIGKSQSREIPYATHYDKHVYYKDETGYALKEFYTRLQFTFRDGIHNLHNLSLSYESYKFADTVLVLNPDFVNGDIPESEMFSISYSFKHDYRDNKPYPLDGHYFDAELTQRGLGHFVTSPDFFAAKSTFDFYKPLGNRFYWASSLSVKFSENKEQPYFLTRGLGYGNEYVRSYELYVVDGQDYGLMKNNLKFALLTPRNGKIPVIKSEKFNKIHYALYMNLLFDAAFVSNSKINTTSTLQNKLLFGGGVGIDLVTYYDLVFRVEYSINQYGDRGFFVHFMAPI